MRFADVVYLAQDGSIVAFLPTCRRHNRQDNDTQCVCVRSLLCPIMKRKPTTDGTFFVSYVDAPEPPTTSQAPTMIAFGRPVMACTTLAARLVTRPHNHTRRAGIGYSRPYIGIDGTTAFRVQSTADMTDDTLQWQTLRRLGVYDRNHDTRVAAEVLTAMELAKHTERKFGYNGIMTASYVDPVLCTTHDRACLLTIHLLQDGGTCKSTPMLCIFGRRDPAAVRRRANRSTDVIPTEPAANTPRPSPVTGGDAEQPCGKRHRTE